MVLLLFYVITLWSSLLLAECHETDGVKHETYRAAVRYILGASHSAQSTAHSTTRRVCSLAAYSGSAAVAFAGPHKRRVQPAASTRPGCPTRCQQSTPHPPRMSTEKSVHLHSPACSPCCLHVSAQAARMPLYWAHFNMSTWCCRLLGTL